MTHYIAIIEDAGPDLAVGVWFPDLPGCFSAGDDLDDAMKNAPEAVALYVEALDDLPPARSLEELKADPAVAQDMKNYMFAVVEVPAMAYAAE